MRNTMLILCGLAALTTGARAGDCVPSPNRLADDLRVSSGYSLDASYFTDADELRPPPGLNGNARPELLAPGRRAFCSRNEYDVTDALASDEQTKISFDNPAGFFGDVNKTFGAKIFNTGLCWWHTRFQRSASYLANYFPGKPKPSHEEALKIISRIKDEESVVEIPGYADLASFTKDYEKEITSELNKWMLGDWISGRLTMDRLFDTSSENPSKLHVEMESLYDRTLQKPQLIFLRVREKGVTPLDSHALLMTRMVPIRGKSTPANPMGAYSAVGYQFSVIDSNHPTQVTTVDYRFGEKTIKYCPPGEKNCVTLIPRPAYDDDLEKIEGAVGKYCTPAGWTAKR